MQAHQVLHKLIITTCPDMHKTRRDALEATVQSALIGRRLTVTDLGRSIQSKTCHKHNIKRADRLLSNPHLALESMEIARVQCHHLLGSRTRPAIIVDWSDMDKYKQHFVLRAGITLEGRCLTLYEEVHTIKTKEKLQTHAIFLERLSKIIPKGCAPILITDAGFRTTWFKLVQALGWDWIGRVRNRHYMRWSSGGRWFNAKQCYQQASSRPKYLGEGVLTIRNKIDCQFIVYQGKLKGRKHYNRFGEPAHNTHSHKKAIAQREPWLLTTSLPVTSGLAKKVTALYRERMQIEEGFRDVKSHRFGLGLNYHRTHTAVRLQMLLLIANLALMVIWLLGCAAKLRQQHFQFQANSVRHKQVLSVIFIGIQMIRDTRIKLSRQDINDAWDVLKEVRHGW